MKKVFLILFLVSNIYAQVEYSQQRDGGSFLPNFYIDLASYKSQDSGKAKIDIFIKVPYANLQFLKYDNNYIAKYAITISIYDDDDEIKLEKLWNEKVETNDFKQTASYTSFNISYKSILLNAGRYKFVCKIEDAESRKYSTYENEINVREYNDEIELSDLVIVSEFIETPDGIKTVPSISNQVTSKDSSLSFFYNIYCAQSESLKVSYSINNKEGEPLYVKEKDFILHVGTNEINEVLDKITFTIGEYQLEIRLLDKDFKMIKGSGKKFTSKIFGYPSSIKDLDMAIKQMQYIATPSEIDEIEEAGDYNARLKKYLEYWKRLDPSPNTVENETLNEYYRRIEYANANFSGYFKGWRSDMGMVYVTLGAPDQVIRRPYEMDSKPYEVWDYYNLNRRFIFVDQTNFGDYRLQDPVYGDWFRYRP